MRECDGRSCWKSCLTRPTAFPTGKLAKFRKQSIKLILETLIPRELEGKRIDLPGYRRHHCGS
jgi:hypothetical protein